MSRISIPDALKPITPYVLRSMDLSSRNAVVSFYCLQYAVHMGVDLLQAMAEPEKTESTKFLMTQMDRLEKEKEELGANDEEGRAVVELYALKMFKRADDADREGRQDAIVAKLFYTSSLLMEITKQFGDLTEDIMEKQKYARWKATEINRAVKMGLAPTKAESPAHNVQNEAAEEDMEEQNVSRQLASSSTGNFAFQQQQQQWQQQAKAAAQSKPAARKSVTSTPSSSSHTTSSSSVHGSASNGSGKDISLDDIMLAQKYSKFAVSSLQFNDVPAAKKYLQDALNLLNQ